MKKYRTIEKKVETKEFKVVDSITCDLCGDETNKNWKTEPYDATETDISMKTGNDWPEGGSGDLIEVDICPTCFKDKLIPWVRSQGGTETVTEWDW